MSRHLAFRRQPVDPGQQQQLRTMTIPAPTRGIIQNENESFMQPGGALILDNWMPTLQGIKIRGGYVQHCALPTTNPVISAFEYQTSAQSKMYVGQNHTLWDVTTSTPVSILTGT